MKQFFKTFFASCLGSLTGLGCLFVLAPILLISTAVAALSGSDSQEVSLHENTVLKIDLSTLSEIVEEDPFSRYFGESTEVSVALSDVLETIKYAKNNPNIKGIYLNVERMEAGMASVDALRRALVDFKTSGKFIIAYGDGYNQKSYYLASVANTLLLNPQGEVGLLGIASQNMLFRPALEKLGVEMQVFKVGTYKSAVEPYILDHISEANREQIAAYIGGIWDSILGGISSGRNIAVDSLRTFVDRGEALSATTRLVDFGLVDSLVYRSDVKSIVEQRVGKESDLRMISLNDLNLYRLEHDRSTGDEDNRIAVVFAEGEIAEASGGVGSMQTQIDYSLATALRDLAEDEDVKAVVLRINSPGGSAFLSEQIWHEMVYLKGKKPVVVSMGDLAASGGYYISAPATKIVAEPNTLTGSIGIFGLIPNASGFAKKIGVNVDMVKTSDYASLASLSLINPMSEGEKKLIQQSVERGYDTFISRVAEGRHMTKAQVDSIGQGRVWLGAKAKELGLVDELGGLDTAIKLAAKSAGLKSYYTDYSQRTISFFDRFSSFTNSDDFVARVRYFFMSKEERQLMKLLRQQDQSQIRLGLQMRLPYDSPAY